MENTRQKSVSQTQYFPGTQHPIASVHIKPDDESYEIFLLEAVEPATGRAKNVFCPGDSIDIRLTNTSENSIRITLLNAGNGLLNGVLYQGQISSGRWLLSVLKNADFGVGETPGTLTIWAENRRGDPIGNRIITSIQQCGN